MTSAASCDQVVRYSKSPFLSAATLKGTPNSRREAIAQPRRVAEYFPHRTPQPGCYLADKAASWGEMPLHVWLKRVIKDGGTLSQMEEMLDVGDGTPDAG